MEIYTSIRPDPPQVNSLFPAHCFLQSVFLVIFPCSLFPQKHSSPYCNYKWHHYIRQIIFTKGSNELFIQMSGICLFVWYIDILWNVEFTWAFGQNIVLVYLTKNFLHGRILLLIIFVVIKFCWYKILWKWIRLPNSTNTLDTNQSLYTCNNCV